MYDYFASYKNVAAYFILQKPTLTISQTLMLIFKVIYFNNVNKK